MPSPLAGWALVRTKSYTVPDLVGIQEEVALNEISGNDWTVEREIERSDEFPEPGTVIRTVPAAGIKLDEGETFVIVRERGPEAAGAARGDRAAAGRRAGRADRAPPRARRRHAGRTPKTSPPVR